ncbi:FAD/NAD(P)-binding domain-containing protein [Saccharata proteae CBS 121410]|uniref:FAD/NAD(P)-binding domain-containing protein n=1 Tax=Saccharata proteae CBS 121410 TaxID=1314787 RepID=A0A6A5YD93_9PEZI|nr:FAD/NAD(P)-binding domain-containing protein [Saccharata proteae CBS 121410]
MSPQPTVLIIGAGPVGVFLALRLAQSNIPVTVLEAQQTPETGAKAMTHMPTVFAEFKKAGIYEDLVSAAKGLVNGTVCFRRTSDKSVIAATPQVPGRPGPLTVPQHTFRDIVIRHLSKLENAEVLMGHRLESLQNSDSSISITARTPSNTTQTFTGTYLIGADGGKSAVRHAASIPFEGETLPRQLVATDIYYPFDTHGWTGGNFMADPEFYGLIGPITSDGLWRVSYGCPAGQTKSQIEQEQPAKFSAMFPGPQPLAYKVEKTAPYKAQQLCAATFRKGRVLLVGDAAHLTNPYAGMGLGTGLLDASSLAEVLTSHLRRGAPDTLLDAWARARRDVFKNIVDPFSRACFWSLQDEDVESLPERHPLLKALNAGPRAKPPALGTEVEGLEGWVGVGE